MLVYHRYLPYLVRWEIPISTIYLTPGIPIPYQYSSSITPPLTKHYYTILDIMLSALSTTYTLVILAIYYWGALIVTYH